MWVCSCVANPSLNIAQNTDDFKADQLFIASSNLSQIGVKPYLRTNLLYVRILHLRLLTNVNNVNISSYYGQWLVCTIIEPPKLIPQLN